ncbi:MAG: hypothetical protein GY803_28965, partial [Chloroflexi bacterium]|nr:hypothetical protein [Chloroflexota bacterium]
MIPLRDLLKETAVSQQNDDRSALRFAIGMNIIIAAVLIIARIMIQQQRASLILGPFSPVVMGGFIISALLIWRNRKIMGAALFATLLMFVAGAVISQRHGLGIMLAIDAAVLSSLMLSRALPQRLIGIGISLITVGGVGLLAAELYWPTPRLAAQEFMPPALFAITVVILLFLTLNIARQFADYSLRAKLVFTFLAITFIPLSITALVNSMVAKQARIDSANQRLLTTASQTAVSIDDFLNNTLNN